MELLIPSLAPSPLAQGRFDVRCSRFKVQGVWSLDARHGMLEEVDWIAVDSGLRAWAVDDA